MIASPPRDPADYGPVGGDDSTGPEESVCRTCGFLAIEHTHGYWSVYGECPSPAIRARLAAAEATIAGGAELIAAERRRQITSEGWTPEHDAEHPWQMARAAACYADSVATTARLGPSPSGLPPMGWPWGRRYWKPTPDDPVKQLVKAGALIAAEIDRLRALDGDR